MKKTVFFLSLLAATTAVAATGHEAAAESHEGIPFATIGWQAANLGILLIILFFAIKKSIVETFAKRQQDFKEKSEKTKIALQGAEQALAEIKAKLNQLESGEKKSLETAQHEANMLMANMVKEAEVQAEKMRADAKMLIQTEFEKAKAEISTLIFSGAVVATTKKISDKSAQITKDSESEFLKQISQVRA
jgi:F-type H+-transporting ATPase subunit b